MSDQSSTSSKQGLLQLNNTQKFEILVHGIEVYTDEELQNESFGISIGKNTIIPGIYCNNKKVVLLSEPYNLYCSSLNVKQLTNNNEYSISTSEEHLPTPETIEISLKHNHRSSQINYKSTMSMDMDNISVMNYSTEDITVEKDNTLHAFNDERVLLQSRSPSIDPPDGNISNNTDDEPQPMPPPLPIELRDSLKASQKLLDDNSPVINEDDIKYNNNNMKISADMSTGNLLEDADNLLRIYINLQFDDNEREKVYFQFWQLYYELLENKSYELLRIPIKVRGFLKVMTQENERGICDTSIVGGMNAYLRDKIMCGILSNNGLIQEPSFIERYYIYKIFIDSEIWLYFHWFYTNITSLKAWMFLFLCILLLAQIIHIGIDFGNGNIWRAFLMQFLIPFTCIAGIQYVDTPFTGCILRVMIEDHCASLCTVEGRLFLNLLLIFFSCSSMTTHDIFLLLAASGVGVWTVIYYITYQRFCMNSNYIRIATGSAKNLKKKFHASNHSSNGILILDELEIFFRSYNMKMSHWQLEIMISEYDIHHENGLRFTNLQLWFEHLPINCTIRRNALSELAFNNIVDICNDDGGGSNVLSDREKEWIGLAGDAHRYQDSLKDSGPRLTTCIK